MLVKSSEEIGMVVKNTRKSQGLTQEKLAKLCNIGARFIVDLENGKPTCQIAKTLIVLNGLGIKVDLTAPAANPLVDYIEVGLDNKED
jgi:y4mF family transcriptional regulator